MLALTCLLVLLRYRMLMKTRTTTVIPFTTVAMAAHSSRLKPKIVRPGCIVLALGISPLSGLGHFGDHVRESNANSRGSSSPRTAHYSPSYTGNGPRII